MAAYDRALYQAYLATVPMFRSCTPEQLDRLASLGETVSATDSDIIREGDPGDAFFVVTSGKARVLRGGRELAELGKGDFFGELSLFDPAPRDATVTAVGVVSLISLSRDAFRQAIDQTPALRDALLHGMAHRLHALDARV